MGDLKSQGDFKETNNFLMKSGCVTEIWYNHIGTVNNPIQSEDHISFPLDLIRVSVVSYCSSTT